MKPGTLLAAFFGAGLILTARISAAQPPPATAAPQPPAASEPPPGAERGGGMELRPAFCPPCRPLPPERRCHVQLHARVGDAWTPVVTASFEPRFGIGLTSREATLYRAQFTMCSGAGDVAPVYFEVGAGDDCSVAMPPLPPCPPFGVTLVAADLRLSRVTRLTFTTLSAVPTLRVSQERWGPRGWEPARTEDLRVTRNPRGEATVGMRETTAGVYRIGWDDPSGGRQQVTYEVRAGRP